MIAGGGEGAPVGVGAERPPAVGFVRFAIVAKRRLVEFAPRVKSKAFRPSSEAWAEAFSAKRIQQALLKLNRQPRQASLPEAAARQTQTHSPLQCPPGTHHRKPIRTPTP